MSTSPTQFRSDAVIHAEELSKAADLTNGPRIPELRECEAMADHVIAVGDYKADGLIGAPNSEPAQLFQFSPDGRAGWARRP